ncbi:MAG TPA: methyltransferase domain-containing protein [Flavobacteriaceae bacterium]|nr:methyltransferase domain-containing protein [Flavobacteriaceae bacterium]
MDILRNYKKQFDTNKETWNKKVAFHKESDFYNVNSFLKGKTSLNALELEELGSVKNKSLLHLQCHFGLDTLSWARLGAKCIGIDISEEAIKKAQELASQLKLNSTFKACNVYDVSKEIKQTFDIVFTSYGVVGWLPNLEIWAKIIAEKLNKGGVFYMAEFHPIVWMFDYLEEQPKIKYPYSGSEAIYEEYKGTYANTKADMLSKEYGWNHGLGQVVTALANAGLRVEFLREHYQSPYNCLPNLKQNDDGLYVFEKNLFPIVYSIKAVKKA